MVSKAWLESVFEQRRTRKAGMLTEACQIISVRRLYKSQRTGGVAIPDALANVPERQHIRKLPTTGVCECTFGRRPNAAGEVVHKSSRKLAAVGNRWD